MRLTKTIGKRPPDVGGTCFLGKPLFSERPNGQEEARRLICVSSVEMAFTSRFLANAILAVGLTKPTRNPHSMFRKQQVNAIADRFQNGQTRYE